MNRLAAYALAAVAVFLAGFFYGGHVQKSVDTVAYQKLEATIAQREKAAADKARQETQQQAEVAKAAAVAEATAQQKIITRYVTTIQEVDRYVTPAQDARGCVTYGFVRVLDAAAQGLDPASLRLPAGKSDDACTDLQPSAVARNIAGNYGVGLQNAAQLDGLIGYERARVAAAED